MSDKGFGFNTIVHLMCDDEETYQFRRLIVLLYFCKLVILFQAVLDVVQGQLKISKDTDGQGNEATRYMML